MVRKKSQSKRMSCSKRFKITKRAAEKHRKDRKDAKKNPRTKRTKKDPGIPNNWPFKEELLNQIEEEKIKEAESKERNKRLCQRLQKKIAAAEAKAQEADTEN
ncbi:nuclear GTP-binding protein nug1 [Basidiobolus ranarum]|uniref:Nuclear GTP-binding protein nug1 n=1 Tax=Basidiobolus ranarum TaxID=34480 RepID=A0ABR2WUL9_9FUNG